MCVWSAAMWPTSSSVFVETDFTVLSVTFSCFGHFDCQTSYCFRLFRGTCPVLIGTSGCRVNRCSRLRFLPFSMAGGGPGVFEIFLCTCVSIGKAFLKRLYSVCI
jgi:hypothetical protein